ncbi:putative apyrase 6 [Acorus calamus]|uniref:Apyrase 6 n=1 Tax=Acorus calamus TaxID=4465 RepID=A0AAV9F2U9_ACOCL|nr:putative apyrase 6 [Acorus calamus]
MDFTTLQSRVSPAYIPPHRTQLHPRMHAFTSRPPSIPPPSRERWWILAVGLLILPFLLYLVAIARGVHRSSRFGEPRQNGYGVVIDAGPGSSRVHVFEFLNEGRIPIVQLDGKGSRSLQSRPGLTAFAEDPESAGGSMEGLIEFARDWVPKAEWKDTKVRLLARMGTEMNGGSDAKGAILESCRRVLRSSGFMFRDEWASIITGQEKGLYAWVATNYALGTLGSEPEETMGIFELGGASSQVTFVPRNPSFIKSSQLLRFAGVEYNLHTLDMHHLSQEAAWDLFGELQESRDVMSSSSSEGIKGNPCIPKGYDGISTQSIELDATGKKPLVGNFSACRSEVLALLQKGQNTCTRPPCNIISSFLPEYQGKALSVDSFFYTSELFGLVQKASLSDLESAAQQYCEDDWDKLKKTHDGIDEADLLRYCFSSVYMVALLHNGLGIPMDAKRIGFANPEGSVPLDWTLGAFILQTVAEPEVELDNLGDIVGNDAVIYLSLFAFLFLVILAAFYVSRWHKPRLKTVYDLEKGYYIVKSVSR